jgi:hypothetical protein
LVLQVALYSPLSLHAGRGMVMLFCSHFENLSL